MNNEDKWIEDIPILSAISGVSQEDALKVLMDLLKEFGEELKKDCIPLFEEVIKTQKNLTPGEQVQRAVDGALKDITQGKESPDLRMKLGYTGSAFMKIMTAKYIVIYHLKGEKQDGDGTADSG